MSIAKIIHLCWFGRGEYPKLAEMCIQSWEKLLPDYEIKIWNEDNFDVNSCHYTKKAYEEKKWAFISDYVRLTALYQYGGIYMDTDLEVIKDFSDLLVGKQYVSSYIEGGLITAGFIACEKKHPYIRKILDYYDSESKKIEQNQKMNFVMNPLIFTKIAVEEYGFNMKDSEFYGKELTIYPLEYFMPYRKVNFGKSYSRWKYHITSNTYTIHHDMSSWKKGNKIKKILAATTRLLLPQKIYISQKINKNRFTMNETQKTED